MPIPKWNNEKVDKWLKENKPNLIRISDYTYKDKMLFRCNDCNYDWKTIFKLIRYNSKKCLLCDGKAPVDNYLIDKIILDNNLNIERISDARGAHTPIKFKCKDCDYNWETEWRIINGSLPDRKFSCPRCVGYQRWNNKDIDEFLEKNERKIIRLGEFCAAKDPMEFGCLVCNHTWFATWSDVRGYKSRAGTGCARCAGKYHFNNNDFDEFLSKNKPTIIRLGDYGKTRTDRVLCKCLECKNQFKAIPESLFEGFGCPHCSGNAKITNEDIDNFIKNNKSNLIRLEDVISNTKQILFKCLDCNKELNISPKSLRRAKEGGGCRYCSNEAITSAQIDLFIKEYERPILRLSECNTGTDEVDFKCLICNAKFTTFAGNIIWNFGGCSECSVHKNEQLVGFTLRKLNIEYRHQFPLKLDYSRMRIDFYIPCINLFIEYNGEQHYQPVKFGGVSDEEAQSNFQKQQLRDQSLRDYCSRNKINLLEIDGRKYRNKSLIEFLNQYFIKKYPHILHQR